VTDTPLTVDAAMSLAQRWQALLRLQDWDVKIELARLADLGAGTLGDCSPNLLKRQTRIRLLDPRDVDGQGFWFDGEAWDWETTLVHELLHLHFHDVVPSWDEGRPDAKAAERAIDAMAKALILLDRRAEDGLLARLRSKEVHI
jgi:hypothetical protein